MEKLLGMLHSHGESERAITLPALAPPWSFAQPVADWLGARRRSPQCEEDDFSSENFLFSFDVDYQKSTDFHPGAEPHLDWEFEPADSPFNDVETAIPAWLDFFDAPEMIGQPRTEQGLPLGEHLMVELN